MIGFLSRMQGRISLALLIGLLAALLASSASAEDAQNIAVILKLKGSVEHQAANTENWALARQGQALDSGDRLRTGGDGEAALIFVDDRSLLKLSAETEVSFRAGLDGPDFEKRLVMGAGQIWAKVTGSDTPRFSVETPTSVASVKGSEFYSLEHPGSGNTFYALTGKYVYGNEHGEIDIGPGTTGRSDGQNPPSSQPTDPGDLPGFGGILGYGARDGDEQRTLRIEFENEDGEEKTLVIPFDRPE